MKKILDLQGNWIIVIAGIVGVAFGVLLQMR